MADEKKTNVDELYKKFEMGDYDKLNQSVKEGVKSGKLNEGLAGRILKMASEKMEEEGKTEDNFQTYQDLKTYSNVFGDRYKESRGLGPKKANKEPSAEQKVEEPKKEESVEDKKKTLLDGFKEGPKAIGNTIIPSAGAAPLPEGIEISQQQPTQLVNQSKPSSGATGSWDEPSFLDIYSRATNKMYSDPSIEQPTINSTLNAEVPSQVAPQVTIPEQEEKSTIPVQNDMVDIQQMNPQDKIGNAITNMGAIESDQKMQESQALQAQQREMAKIEEDRLDRAQKVQQAIDEEELNFKQTMDEVGSKGIDPGRYYNSMTTGNKILAGIAVILSSKGDKGNSALDMLNKAVDQDIEAQKQDILNLKDKATAKKSIMSDMYNKLGDVNKAADYAKLAMLQSTKNQIDIMAAKSGSAQALEKAALQKGMLDQQMEMQKAKIMEKYADRAEAYTITKDTDPRSIVNEKLAERFIPGVGLASTKDNAIKLAEKKAVIDDINQNLDRLREISARNFSSLNWKERDLAQQKAKLLVGKLRLPVTGPGPLTDSEREFILSLIGDGTKLFSIKDVQLNRIDSLKKDLNKSFANEAKTRGVVGFDTADTLGFKPKN